MTKVALYARVSTDNQDLERQVAKLKRAADKRGWDCDLFKEQVSSISERPKFNEIMENLDEYDKIVVTKIDRFARSIKQFTERVQELKQYDCDFIALDQPVNTDDEMYGDFMMKLLALFAELERKMIRRRLEEGYNKAREEGRIGRPRKITGDALETAKELWEEGGSSRFIANHLKGKYDINVSPKTVLRTLEREGVKE